VRGPSAAVARFRAPVSAAVARFRAPVPALFCMTSTEGSCMRLHEEPGSRGER
jgi:hypothetical protein